jgi:hypothetical protein
VLDAKWALFVAAGVAVSVGGTARAGGEDPPPQCRVLELSFTPASELQIVVWLETPGGQYFDTVFVTRKTGSYGLGNRPGMMEFNSAWAWPYGRRVSVFPIWAHRHGMTWAEVVFQNGDDTNLSHPLSHSSMEKFYCRPLRPGESAWDTQTCASIIYTDKGVLSTDATSLYPPRSDVTFTEGIDHPSVATFASLNPFDAVSRATPPGGEAQRLLYPIPETMPDGDYVAWAEVSAEWDQNGIYDFPSPTGIPWDDYGLAYRGQPSVLYRVPFSLAESSVVAMTDEYAGYGDPGGADGELHAPDATIEATVNGSGASRFGLTADTDGTYRFKVATRPAFDTIAPGAASAFKATAVTPTAVTATFVAPGTDGQDGTVSGYELRYQAVDPITEESFAEAEVAATYVAPRPAGTVHTVTFDGLQPNSNYYFAVRGYDDCFNRGPIAVLHALTPRRENGEVDACFIATAAYGSPLAADVAMLRRFRDVALRTHIAGELVVEAYYTLGPLLADVIEPSATLRRLARALLRPAVGLARRALGRLAGGPTGL